MVIVAGQRDRAGLFCVSAVPPRIPRFYFIVLGIDSRSLLAQPVHIPWLPVFF